MGLDIHIYKASRKRKAKHIEYFGRGYWFIVTYLETIPNIKVDSLCEVKITREHVKTFIEKCRDVLLCYYNHTFDWYDRWVNIVKDTLPIWKNAEDKLYNKQYIENVSVAYEVFLELYKELNEDDAVWVYVSY